MFASLIIAAAAGTQTLAPMNAPPVVTRRIISNHMRIAQDSVDLNADPTVVIPVRVRITAGNHELLSDTFRISRNDGASYQQSRSEAPVGCSEQRPRYGSQQRNSLNLNLYLRDDGSGTPMVNVSVQWQRPSAPPVCVGEGSRQVQLSQTVPLAAGQAVTLQGDAGLTVTLSR